MVAGMATPAMRAITAGARTRVPTCQITIFFRLHTCFPQNVPENMTENFDTLLKTYIQRGLESASLRFLSNRANRTRPRIDRSYDYSYRHPFL